MEYPYTIYQLCNKLGKSKQAIYALLAKKQELIQNNSIRNQRKIYYSQAVLDYLEDYYTNGTPLNAPNKPIDVPALAHEENITQTELDALHAKIKALEEKLEEKDKQVAELLMLLSLEKQEKMLYLPSPKKSIGERIKNLFSKGQSSNKEV